MSWELARVGSCGGFSDTQVDHTDYEIPGSCDHNGERPRCNIRAVMFDIGGCRVSACVATRCGWQDCLQDQTTRRRRLGELRGGRVGCRDHGDRRTASAMPRLEPLGGGRGGASHIRISLSDGYHSVNVHSLCAAWHFCSIVLLW